jgi:hypothetical protein
MGRNRPARKWPVYMVFRSKALAMRREPNRRSEDPNSVYLSLMGMQRGSGGPGRAYTAYPNLSRVRWLFPAEAPAIRRASVRGLSSPGSVQGRMLKKLMEMGAVRGDPASLESEPLERLERQMARLLGETEVRVAFYVGVPGAYRKVMAQVMTPDGDTLAYAKIGITPLARAAVEGEGRVLLRLFESAALRGTVPHPLGRFEWQGGAVLLMTGGPTRPGPQRLSAAHARFCEDAFLSFAQESVFELGPMWARMKDLSRRLAPDLPESLAACYDRALRRLGTELGPVPLPLSLAHRDFAPWNTRLGSGSLFVFDWERAEEGTTPLYDVFHFWAIQAALFPRRRRPPDRGFLQDLLDKQWPEAQEYLRWLYLAYLVDMSLDYSNARVIAPDVGEQRVWRWFAEQVRSFLEEGPPL